MIDEYWTWIFYGYHSGELSYGSGRPIVAMCDDCCRYAILKYRDYHDHCYQCSTKHRSPHTENTKLKMSKSATGIKRNFSQKSYPNMSEAHKGITHSPESRRKISESNTGKHMSEEARRKLSATHQGIPYEEWTEFVCENRYCEKFDDACRERIRTKYHHACFICGKSQKDNITKNNKQKKLSVHHVDKDRGQGCNGVKWNLVPLCMSCHPSAHKKIWIARIEYLLDFVWV